MDDQRLEEIAEKAFWEIESHIYANRDTLAKMVIGAAIREALSSQEEALRSLREERDALHAQLSGVGIVPYLDRMKELADARDAAEAELQRLRDAWNGGQGHPDNVEPYLVAKRHAVDRLLASSVKESQSVAGKE